LDVSWKKEEEPIPKRFNFWEERAMAMAIARKEKEKQKVEVVRVVEEPSCKKMSKGLGFFRQILSRNQKMPFVRSKIRLQYHIKTS